MINKVLIAEDHESANISVQKTLEEMGIMEMEYVYYCDDALVRVQKAVDAGVAFDLLITDLYFDADHRKVKIDGGAALIQAVREVQPELRILVFSGEGKISVIENLYTEHNIDGYIRKGRSDARELKTAIVQVAANERYFPRFYVEVTRHQYGHAFTPYDVMVISLLAKGMRQQAIADYLLENGINPSGLSSLEKRLKEIRTALKFTNNAQLAAYCTDLGII
jgi:DNA-binding NarL/FixJ family response regulator